MLSYKFNGRGLTQDCEPKSSGQRVIFLLHRSFGLYLFISKALSWIWVIGSGRNLLACMLNECLESSRWIVSKRERGTWRGVKARPFVMTLSLSSWPSLLLFPPTPEPRPQGAVTSERDVTERPVGLAGKVTGAAQSEEQGSTDGGCSKWRNESCLSNERMFGQRGEMEFLLSVVVIKPSKSCTLFIHCHTFVWTSATLLHCCGSGLAHC